MSKSELIKGQTFRLFNINFTIEDEVDSGGFGKIFLLKKDNARFAMKSIILDDTNYHFTKSSEYNALMNEFKICITMEPNQNIVTFVSFYKDKSNHIFAIMEYIEHGNLAALIGKKGIEDVKTLLDIAIDISSGLSYLHSHNIVHRDLNPYNVLLEKSTLENNVTYVAKITDFGLSSLIKGHELSFAQDKNSEEKLLDSSDFVGNQFFVSPEQLNKSSLGRERDTDIFAFGMTMCYLITGGLPFRQEELTSGYDYYESVIDLRNKIYSFLSNHDKQIDCRIIDVVVNCLHYHPSFRWKVEKDNHTFRYFETIKTKIEEIRKSLFGNLRIINSVMEGEYLLYQMKGVSLLNLEDYTNAREMLLKSHERNPKNINTLCNLGLAYKGLGEYDIALSHLDEALTNNMDDAEIYIYIGNVFSEKLYDSNYVIDCYDKALRLDPNNYSAYYNKGIYLYYNENGCSEPREYFERAYELNKEDPLLNFYLGICYLEEKKMDLCERLFNESIESSGKSVEFYKRVIINLRIHKEYEIANEFCKQGRDPHLHIDDQELIELEKTIKSDLKL
jgi:serine/threonine protein kinase